eukprot:jgi/Mesen1/5253/ME000263S04362
MIVARGTTAHGSLLRLLLLRQLTTRGAKRHITNGGWEGDNTTSSTDGKSSSKGSGSRGMFAGQATGSGVIIREDGVILTNAHVLVVTLQDGRSFEGQLVAADSLADIAVVKIATGGTLPVAQLGSARTLRPGDWVVAVGSPLKLSNTVTAGIVSCVERKSSEMGLRGAHSDYIQTDAAINQGNSGGPLVNLDGEVVGVNYIKALAAHGVSFAIPIDTAVRIMEQLAKHGRVVRPFVGIKMLELRPGVIEQLQERDPSFPSVAAGVLVPQVIPGSPAARAGMQAGDVIVEFDNKPCTSTRQILEALGDRIGESINVTVMRGNNKKHKLSIVTEEITPNV